MRQKGNINLHLPTKKLYHFDQNPDCCCHKRGLRMGETRGKQGETRSTMAENAINCATGKRPCIRSKLKAIRCRSTRLTIVSPCFPHVSPSFPPHCKIRFVKNLLYFATNVWVFCVEMHINIPKLCQPSAPLSRTINALFGLFPPGGGNWVSSPEYKSPRC